MRISIILLVALACLIAASEAQKGKGKGPKPGKCDRKCTTQVQPVCATRDKGKTYRRFSNSCLLGIENCKTNNAWKKVDLKKCLK